jgi:hypothetical protein
MGSAPASGHGSQQGDERETRERDVLRELAEVTGSPAIPPDAKRPDPAAPPAAPVPGAEED